AAKTGLAIMGIKAGAAARHGGLAEKVVAHHPGVPFPSPAAERASVANKSPSALFLTRPMPAPDELPATVAAAAAVGSVGLEIHARVSAERRAESASTHAAVAVGVTCAHMAAAATVVAVGLKVYALEREPAQRLSQSRAGTHAAGARR